MECIRLSCIVSISGDRSNLLHNFYQRLSGCLRSFHSQPCLSVPSTASCRCSRKTSTKWRGVTTQKRIATIPSRDPLTLGVAISRPRHCLCPRGNAFLCLEKKGDLELPDCTSHRQAGPGSSTGSSTSGPLSFCTTASRIFCYILHCGHSLKTWSLICIGHWRRQHCAADWFSFTGGIGRMGSALFQKVSLLILPATVPSGG